MYCREWDTHSCYVRTPECSWDGTALYCNVSKYGESKSVTYVNVTINELKAKCHRWKEVSGCDVSVTFDDKSLDILHNKKDLELTKDLKIDVTCPSDNQDPCRASFLTMCDENYSMKDCKIILPTTSETSPTTKPTKPIRETNDDQAGTSTTLLIVIIIILLLLLLLYVGYQNHQKVSY